MITLRRATERQYLSRGKHDLWQTFRAPTAEDRSAEVERFGALDRLDESCLRPGGAIALRSDHRVEVITYVRQGSLAHEDSSGRSSIVSAGEFQRVTVQRALRHEQRNASRADVTHAIQLRLESPRASLAPSAQQRRFTAGQRRGLLCVVASPDARGGSLQLSQDVVVCSSLLDPGQHVVHALTDERKSWVHVVSGEITLGESILTAGDGAAIAGERAVSLTARQSSEILIIDLRA